MPKSMLSTVKFGLIIAVTLLAGIGSLYVVKLVEADFARELAVMAMLLTAVFTAGSLAIAAFAGSSKSEESLTDGRR